MVATDDISLSRVRALLEQIMDPEIPVLSIIDLGIIRDVRISLDATTQERTVEVSITPTYSGCPAMDVINMSIRMQLMSEGFKQVVIKQVLSPAWTTDWMTERGKQRLKEYGIAPPNPSQSVCEPALFAAEESVQCPRCESWHTHRLSEFGSTACKSLYQCDSCKEAFDYFKCH